MADAPYDPIMQKRLEICARFIGLRRTIKSTSPQFDYLKHHREKFEEKIIAEIKECHRLRQYTLSTMKKLPTEECNKSEEKQPKEMQRTEANKVGRTSKKISAYKGIAKVNKACVAPKTNTNKTTNKTTILRSCVTTRAKLKILSKPEAKIDNTFKMVLRSKSQSQIAKGVDTRNLKKSSKEEAIRARFYLRNGPESVYKKCICCANYGY